MTGSQRPAVVGVPLMVRCEPCAPQVELGEGLAECEKTGGSCGVTESAPRAALGFFCPADDPASPLGVLFCRAVGLGWCDSSPAGKRSAGCFEFWADSSRRQGEAPGMLA